MNFLSMLGMVVLWIILLMSVYLSTGSKNFEKSIVMRVYLLGGLILLKPLMIGCSMERRSVVVECFVLDRVCNCIVVGVV